MPATATPPTAPPPPDRAATTQDSQPQAAWWRAWFDGAEDPQFVCDPHGQVLDLNRRASQLAGRSRDLRPLSIAEFFSPATAKRLHLALARRSGPPDNIQGVTVILSGKPSWIADLQIAPLAPGASLVSIRDASQRWRMESHVQRLVAAIDATSDVFFLTNADFKLIYVNCAFATTTGVPIEDALGRTADFLRAPGQERAIETALERVRRGTDWHGEFLNIRPDGSTYPVEVSLSPIYDKNGALIGYVCCERDVSARQRLQEQVRRERDLTREIINSIDPALYTLDHQFHITHANEAWKRLPARHGWLELAAAPPIGTPLLDLVPSPEKRAELAATFTQILATGQSQEFQYVEDARHWSVKITPLRDPNQPTGLIYQVLDQTAYHHLQQQLYQAQKMETIGALAAGIADDFNNLLQAIRGNTSLLLQLPDLSPAARSPLAQIDDAANRAIGTTQQLLAFSRSSDERPSLLDFNTLAEETLQAVRQSLPTTIELRFNQAPAPLRTHVIPGRARQILLNLCANAREAMPNGGRLEISLHPVHLDSAQATRAQCEPQAEFLCCTIADTGVGIPPHILPRILDPFFTTKDDANRSGLGLSIAHSNVRQAGGFLEIDSAPDRGATFKIYLPLATAARPPRPVIHTKPATDAARILVADDLDLVREFSKNFLTMAGYGVELAADAESALELLNASAQPFDLLLTDCNMPGMSGVELIAQARKRWPGLRCILVSGFIEDEDLDFIENLPAARVLPKPYNISEALQLIADLLKADS